MKETGEDASNNTNLLSFIVLHVSGRWQTAYALVDEINMRCQLIDDLKIHKRELQQAVNNEYHNKSIAGNDFVIEGNQVL